MRLVIALVAVMALAGVASAADTAPAAAPMAGWFERAIAGLESEAMSDISMAPDASSAIVREWRSFDRNGSALGALVGFAWVAVAAAIALGVERAAARGLSRRPLQRIAARQGGPTLFDLVVLILCDLGGVALFFIVFAVAQRRFLPLVGIKESLAVFASAVLIRWRVVSLIVRTILRPGNAAVRLIDIAEGEAGRLQRFLSAAVLTIIALVGFGRLSLADEDSGAPHVIGLIIAVLVCGLYIAIVLRSRAAAEALIRGRRSTGFLAVLRAAAARAWVAVAMMLVAGLFLFFVAGLSLGLLGYYHAVSSTLGILFVVLVLDRLTERAWHDGDVPVLGMAATADQLHTRTIHRMLRAIGLGAAVMLLAWIWTDAIEMTDAAAQATMRSTSAAVATLFIAFIVWEAARLAIDRHLHAGVSGPAFGDDDDSGAPASRLQTILPLLRAAFAVTIAVVATLIVLSRLGVDTAPLIAGAGVFGLAVSFGSQSLVRDIISGLFYMWDDAFRVGEYIDTGRLKGTVETIGVRSVKVRHQNGPLHTIPYGQLGAVTNLSRDFATIKFNLRFEPGTDVELVRKTTKQIGLAMQQDHPELAAEIMMPLKLQGIAEVVDNAVVLRFKFTARPIKPSWVQREYMKRMYTVFAEKGISFARGALTLQTVSPGPLPPALAATEVPVAEGAVVAAATGAVELPRLPVPTGAG